MWACSYWLSNLVSVMITWDACVNVNLQALHPEVLILLVYVGPGYMHNYKLLRWFSGHALETTALGSTVYEKWQLIRSVSTAKQAWSQLSFAKQSQTSSFAKQSQTSSHNNSLMKCSSFASDNGGLSSGLQDICMYNKTTKANFQFSFCRTRANEITRGRT